MGKHGGLYNDWKWRDPVKGLRIRKLKAAPLCYYCEQAGRITAADTVDHIKAHEGDEALFWDWDNLRSSCTACHNIVAQLKDIHGYAPGVDLEGNPLDPNHPWYKSR
jgi:5-methylcytosine-specific restriction endonuclease McrA